MSTFAGTALLGYLAVERLFSNVALAGRPILLLGVLLMVVGVQFITMGLLGEMLVRIRKREVVIEDAQGYEGALG